MRRKNSSDCERKKTYNQGKKQYSHIVTQCGKFRRKLTWDNFALKIMNNNNIRFIHYELLRKYRPLCMNRSQHRD
jgi:hypothetical protein